MASDKKIQVSTIAKEREQYLSQFQLNEKVKKEWIPRKSSVEKTPKFEGKTTMLSDSYIPICKTFNKNDTFIAPEGGCVVYVLCVGGHGYGTQEQGFGEWADAAWTQPPVWPGNLHGLKEGISQEPIYKKVRAYTHKSLESASPTSFGKYLTANAGVNIESIITAWDHDWAWRIKGWFSGWDKAFSPAVYRTNFHTQLYPSSSGAYNGILKGNAGEVKFGIFKLKSKEVVPVVVGKGERDGHVDIVYFMLANGNGELIDKPSANNVLKDVILPPDLRLHVNPASVSIEINATATLTITTNAKNIESKIKDSNIITYDKDKNVITGIALGSTTLTIIAKSNNKEVSKDIKIEVVAKMPTIFIEPKEVIIQKDTTSKPLTITTKDTQSIESSVLDTKIATYNKDTKEITGVNIGETMIKFVAKNADKVAALGVRVEVIENTTAPTTPETKPTEPTPEAKPQEMLVYPNDLESKLDSMNTEQLAYAYGLAIAYIDIFKPVENDKQGAIMIKPITQELKDKAQKEMYEKHINYADKNTLKHYAAGHISALVQYISYYTKIQGHNKAHLDTLNALIEPYDTPKVIDGATYTHKFKDSVINMETETYLSNLTIWIPELSGIITRKAITPSQPSFNFDKEKVRTKVESSMRNNLVKARDDIGLDGSPADEFIAQYEQRTGLHGLEKYNVDGELDTFIDMYAKGAADEITKVIESKVNQKLITDNTQLENEIQISLESYAPSVV